MRYTQLTEAQVRQMLSVVGASGVDDLFRNIPASLRLKEPLRIPGGVSELEVLRDLAALAAKNEDTSRLPCFLGGGAYDHFVPTLVDALAAQTEFVTGYTPYQAEASQGILQLFYEFQTMVCELTGMEVANASLYELASAAAEAVMMATGITGRNHAVVADNVHPDIVRVLSTYAGQRGVRLSTLTAAEGVVGEDALRAHVTEETAAVVLASPNFFGCVERLDRLIPIVQAAGALAIVATDPIAGGVFKPPGAFGADIVVAEGQALGIPLQYGGPYLGLLACREKFLRKMPGRVVGMTRDVEGRRGFCLALQTREQHIKRERATSNVCTNQGLLAVRASIYMAAMGRQGLANVSGQCFDKAHYAADRIGKIKGFSLRFAAPFFKEFTVRTTKRVRDVLASCRRRGLLAGVPLARFDERYSDCFLVAVTEKRTKDEIDALAAALEAV